MIEPSGSATRRIMFDSARWDGFEFRPDDIVISTPPKCGTTWTQMICALLVFQTTDVRPPLDVISPWLDMHDRARVDDDRRRSRGADPPPLHQDAHAVRRPAARRRRHVHLRRPRPARRVPVVGQPHGEHGHRWRCSPPARTRSASTTSWTSSPKGRRVRAETEIDRFWEWVDDDTPSTDAHEPASARCTTSQTFWDVRERARTS